jgi:hypothetical protein
MNPTELRDLARRIEALPGNAPGSDKTWVLKAMWAQLVFQNQVGRAERVRPH